MKYKVLYLCDDLHPCTALIDHINILMKYSKNDIFHLNPRGFKSFNFDLKQFDVVIIHYSLLIISDYLLPPVVRHAISKFKGLKIQLIQDEYRWVNQIASMMNNLGINILLTLVRDEDKDKAWCQPEIENVEKISILTAYMPKSFMEMNVRPIANRQYDFTYRSRPIPFWLGRLAQDKRIIYEQAMLHAPKYNLKVDLSLTEQKRIYGKKWAKFMQSGKAALGTESGSSIFDYTGEIQKLSDSYCASHPNADFEEVFEHVLKPYEGNLRYTNISPRLFEAVALRTAMVMFPGCYRNTVEPWRHYIPLEKDFSNFADVVDCIKDNSYLQEMVNRTFEEVGKNQNYAEERLAELIDHSIDKHLKTGVYFESNISSNSDYAWQSTHLALKHAKTASKLNNYWVRLNCIPFMLFIRKRLRFLKPYLLKREI